MFHFLALSLNAFRNMRVTLCLMFLCIFLLFFLLLLLLPHFIVLVVMIVFLFRFVCCFFFFLVTHVIIFSFVISSSCFFFFLPFPIALDSRFIHPPSSPFLSLSSSSSIISFASSFLFPSFLLPSSPSSPTLKPVPRQPYYLI